MRTIANDNSQRDDLRHERETRLLRLLTIKAPSSVIAEECRLVLAAHCNGRVRAILWQAGVLISGGFKWYLSRVQCTLQSALHNAAERVRIHLKYPYGGRECWVCEMREFHAEMDQLHKQGRSYGNNCTDT